VRLAGADLTSRETPDEVPRVPPGEIPVSFKTSLSSSPP